MQTAARFSGPFLHISQIPHTISLNKEIFPFLKGSRKGASLKCSSKAGTPWKRTPISSPLLSISFGVPSKGTLPPGSPHTAPSERDAPLLEPSFILLSKSLVYEPPFQVPQWGPYAERCPSPEPTYTHSPGSPVEEPPPGSPHRASADRERERERDALLVQPLSSISQSHW
jgi:hypothetical protein